MAITYLTSIDLAKNQLLNASVQPLATAPAEPVVGQVYFDTSSGRLMIWDGTQWSAVGAGTGGAPSGLAGGDLSGTYPNPQIATGVVTDAEVATNAAISLSKLATNPLDRANHTGTQTANTISDLDDKLTSWSSANLPSSTDVTTIATNVANSRVSQLVDAAPTTLDTLNELAAALGDDPNFAATVSSQIGGLDSRLDALEAVTPVRKYTTTVSGTSATVTHNLGTTDVTVATYSGNALVHTDVTITSADALTISQNPAQTLRVVVTG